MARTDRLKFHRARKRLSARLAHGWQREVHAAPQTPGDAPSLPTEVHEGPGPRAASTAEIDAALARAQAAAERGLVKISFVLDEVRRLEVDARHGMVKTKQLDPERVMAGKQRVLRPDRSGPLLRAIGIQNPDGSISAKNAKKYKQVNHLVELLRPSWEPLSRRSHHEPLRVLDLACGNGYLSFVLVEALRLAEVPVRLHGVDQRADVVERCRERAIALGFAGDAAGSATMSFDIGSVAELDADAIQQELGGPADLMVSLHACDTATDEVIARAVVLGVPALFVVPCCQAEIARQLASLDSDVRAAWAPLGPMVEHGQMRNEYAASWTDALRVAVLEAEGYDVAVVEFVSSEHTPKNRLIRAMRGPGGASEEARRSLARRVHAGGLRPKLMTLLENR